MSHSTVGFFAGNLVVDENLTAEGPLPANLDGKVRAREDSRLSGGSAANAAITFGMLAKLDQSNGGGMAHLYTYSEPRTPAGIVDDLERHNVHLKKAGIIDRLGQNTVISHERGKKLLVVRQPAPPRDTLRAQQSAIEAFARVRNMVQQTGAGADAMATLDQLQGAMASAFAGVADLVPAPAENWSTQFSADLAGSSIVMIDMHYPEITLRAAKEARELGIPVMLDLGRWADHAQALIEHSDIVIASHDFSIPGREKMKPEEILKHLNQSGIRKGAVTRGHLPTLFYDYDDPNAGGYHEDEVAVPKESRLVSTSGAGDVMHGAAAYATARGRHFGEALWQGNRVSSLSVAFPDKRQFFAHLGFDPVGGLMINDPFARPAPTPA